MSIGNFSGLSLLKPAALKRDSASFAASSFGCLYSRCVLYSSGVRSHAVKAVGKIEP